MAPSDAVRIDRLVVKRDRVVCDLSLSPECPRTTSSAIAARAVEALPTLPDHACVNERGNTFGDVIASTPIPHLVEHMVVDLQVRAEEGEQLCGSPKGTPPRPAWRSARTYVGTSEWIDEALGTARVEVSFADDMVALSAFRDAARIVNEIVIP